MDKQTAKLIARISENLPADLDKDVMQGWIMNPKGLQQVLQQALCPPEPKWREKDGIIYFSVTSDGTTGPQWFKRLENKKISVTGHAQSVLFSDDFKPTRGITTDIAILMGKRFKHKNNYCDSRKILAEGDRRKLLRPNAEVACLIREKFTNEEIGNSMGLPHVVVMHKPIKSFDGTPSFLSVNCYDGDNALDTYYINADGSSYGPNDGFAFAVPQFGYRHF